MMWPLINGRPHLIEVKAVGAMERHIDPIPQEHDVTVAYDADRGMATMSFFAFNTIVTFSAFGEQDAVERVLNLALAECRRFERLFSRTLEHSDVSRLNAAHGEMVEVDADTFRLLGASAKFCEESGGAFDITMGAVTRLWNFKGGIIPNEEAILNAILHVGYNGLELYDAGSRFFARLVDPLAAVDLGGMAKGYIADSLSRSFKASGIKSFLLNLGGNIYASGKKSNGEKWRVGVKDPANMANVLGSVELEECAAVTSGTYDRCFTKSGTFYHHILNPATGMPVDTDVVSVTVASPSALTAEGYSTMLLCLGMKKGLEFAASKREIVQAYFVGRDNRIAYARE